MLQTIPRNLLADLLPEMLAEQDSVILVGPPGTGKSTLARDTAAQMGRRYYKVASHPDATYQELVLSAFPWGGNWTVVANALLLGYGYNVVNGKVERTTDGGVVCFDDIHQAGPGMMSTLYTALDSGAAGARILLPDGTTATPGPDYACICTMNGSHMDLDPAVRDRAIAIVPVLEPSDAMLDSLHPLVQILAAVDYDGSTHTPIGTFREWQSMSRLWERFGRRADLTGAEALAYAVMGALGESQRAQKMLEDMATVPGAQNYPCLPALQVLQTGLKSATD